MVEKAGISFDTSEMNSLSTKIDKLRKRVTDLRPAFEQMSVDFYKQQKVLFRSGKRTFYDDLKEKTKQRKLRMYGFTYPILFAEGNLASSLLNRGDANAVNVIRKDEFMIGTNVEYAVYHHSKEQPRNKLPRRPLWQDVPKAISSAKASDRMFFRWKRILETYMEKAAKGLIK